jgi:outer membrane protein insertion porin family
MGDGKANIVTLKTILARRSVDNPLFTRTGSDISLEVALTPPVSMFDRVDYSDPNLSDKQRYNWIAF